MKTILSFFILLAVLLPLSSFADVWQDPETKVNYEYTVGVNEASVKSGVDLWNPGSPSATGDITILSMFTIGGREYRVTNIGSYAFSRNNLTGVFIPSGITNIDGYAFYQCTNLSSIALPQSVNYIGDAALDGCSSLTKVNLPSGLTIINDRTFRNCSKLESIVIPENVTNIGSSTFEGCTNLTTLTIPGSVTFIDEMAFLNCNKLKSIYCYAQEVPYLSMWGVFYSHAYEEATLYVPAASLDAYKSTDPWSKFTHIKAIEGEQPTQKPGDVNGDGAIDVADIAAVISVMAGGKDIPLASADVNGDGNVDVADISSVISIMAGNVNEQHATDYYEIPLDYLNGWDEGVSCISSDESDYYVVSKADTVEAEGGKLSVCINSFENEDINKTVLINYDANGNLHNIFYYGLEFRAEVVSDSMMFVAYDSDGKYVGRFNVPYEVIDVDYSEDSSRRNKVFRQRPFRPFWRNSKGEVSIPKIKDFGQKANALVDLYGKYVLDGIGTALNLSEGKYGDILKDYLTGAFVGKAKLPWKAEIIPAWAAGKMSDYFYEKEKANYLGNAKIEITSIKRTDNKSITVKGILTDISSIPETYSINGYGGSWPNVVYWGVAEGGSGQPGYFLNDECSWQQEITGDNFTYTFYIPEVPGKKLYFRPFLVPKAKLEEIGTMPNPFTCIHYGERKEYQECNVYFSNFKQTKCEKDGTWYRYKVQFTIDGQITGVFSDLADWGINVKTMNGTQITYSAKESSAGYYPPTNKTFTCDLTIDGSEITTSGEEKVAEVTITPYMKLYNDILPIHLESEKYTIKITDGLLSCPDDNHPHWIDLGIGTQWRCCNEGASSPEEYGDYYKFGDVASAPTLGQIKALVDNCSYTWTTQNGVKGGKFTGPNGGTIFLPAAGGRFNYELKYVGSEGYYWSSTPSSEYGAYYLHFSSNGASWGHYNYGAVWHWVRPVR